MRHYIALDIGGTQLRAACYPENSDTPSEIRKISTRDDQSPALSRLLELVQSIWPENGEISAIAAAIPGPTDPYNGIVYVAPNIPGWVNLPLRQALQDRFQVPVAIGNDANLAALGEWKFGAGRGHHHLIYITISTGIGGGIIVNDQLLLGAHGLAAELGHITVDPEGPICSCGLRGHLESFASGTAIARWVENQIRAGQSSSLPAGRNLSAKVIAQAAHEGDQLANAAFERAGIFIGRGIADFLHIFNPTAIIIGGGVSRSGSLLFNPLEKTLQNHVMSPGYIQDLMITTAALGDNAGLMGALALAHSIS